MALIDGYENLPPGALDDAFEERDDDVLDQVASDAGVKKPDINAPDETSPIPGGGKLLEEPSDSKVFKEVDEEVLRQERLARNREQEGLHWTRIKKGVQFSYLEKTEDQAVWEAKLPPGIEDVQQPIPNKVLDLCNKQVSQILVDPPLPNPKPDGDNEKNRSAMDLARQFLRSDGDASGTNDSELWRKVLTLNRTWKTAFIFQWVDPTAGGWRPKQLQAHPQATDPKNPLMGPALDAQGQPQLDEQQQPVLERTADPVLRYVAEVEDPETGELVEQFTEHPAEAAREWLPKHRARVIHPNAVRTLPPTATAFEAHSITLLMWEPLSEARKRFTRLATMSQAELKQLSTWKPKRWKSIVPPAQRPKGEGLDASGQVTDDTLIFWYHKFCRITPDYPDGAEIAVSGASIAGAGTGKGIVLKRDTLREDVTLDDGSVVPVLMDPPVSQFTALHDQDDGDPFGLPPVSLFGGANEIRAHLYLGALEDIDVRLHPNTYLTAASEVTKEDMNRRDGTPIDVLTKDDMPTFEQRPELPRTLPDFLERVDHDMDTLANLSQTAQALDSQYSQSGVAKEVSIHQAKVQLAQDWQGFINGVVQTWKVKLQLAQARLKQPMLVKIGGENSAYKAKHFIGADLVGVTAVALMPGTGTMMNAAEKFNYIQGGEGRGYLDKTEARELFRSSMSDDLGLPPSPHEEHIDRCIAAFLEGPPKDWELHYEAVQAFPKLQQDYAATLQQKVAALVSQGIDQQTATAQATQQVGPAPTQPPPLYTPFEPRANDEEPVVAQIRYTKLSKLLSTTEYSEQPKEWRSTADTAYAAAASAAGIVTVRQQQQAQQAQAQSAQQAELVKIQAEKAATQAAANAPPTWDQFLASVQTNVVRTVGNLAAREVQALGESTSVATKPLPIPTPEQLDDTAGAGATAPEPTHPLDLLHTSMENQRDRAHEASMASTAHANTMEQIAAKGIAQKAAVAERERQKADGTPPIPGGGE